MGNYRKQLNKEAALTVGLYVFYFIWWYFFAYYFGEQEVSSYRYILGLPEWFFYSCVLGLVVINIAVFVVVKCFFRDIPLDEWGNEQNEEGKKC